MVWRCWLGGRKSIRPVKNWVVGCWHGYLSGVRCRLAYVPADATANSLSLASVKSRLVLPFWYRLTWVVPEKEPLNGCMCVCVHARAQFCVCVFWVWHLEFESSLLSLLDDITKGTTVIISHSGSVLRAQFILYWLCLFFLMMHLFTTLPHILWASVGIVFSTCPSVFLHACMYYAWHDILWLASVRLLPHNLHCNYADYTHTHAHTPLFNGPLSGTPRWVSTTRSIHPLTPIVIIRHSLSTSSIYYDPL